MKQASWVDDYWQHRRLREGSMKRVKTLEFDVVQVELDEVEYASAAYSGMLIHHDSIRRGFRDGLNSRRISPLYAHQVGAIAERAVAKALDLYWSAAANTFAKPDLSHKIEVRSARRKGQGLKVRPQDADDKRVVCVLVEEGKEHRPVILGWCFADEGKQKAWLKSPNFQPYYQVPLHELRPIAELKELIRKEIAEGIE